MIPSADDRWYRTAFGPLSAGFWTGLVPQARVDAEARFLADALFVAPGAKLLDIACGAGRQARALGRLGYRVTGIDVSPHMLAASSEGPVEGVTLRQGEMSDLAETSAYDGAYCWGNSFGYLPDAENRGALQRFARALRPGARLVLEVAAVAENVLRSFLLETDMDVGAFHFSARRRYEMAESAMHVVYRMSRGAEVEEFVARQVVYTSAELVRMAAAAGLEKVALFGGIAGEPADLGRPLVAVFRRR